MSKPSCYDKQMDQALQPLYEAVNIRLPMDRPDQPNLLQFGILDTFPLPSKITTYSHRTPILPARTENVTDIGSIIVPRLGQSVGVVCKLISNSELYELVNSTNNS